MPRPALCDIFGIEAGDSDVPLLNAYRPVKARIVSDD
jgi:hypothetical protein